MEISQHNENILLKGEFVKYPYNSQVTCYNLFMKGETAIGASYVSLKNTYNPVVYNMRSLKFLKGSDCTVNL